MQIRAYNPQNGNLLAEDITAINYGNINQGHYCASPVMIQPITTSEDLFSSITLYLQNDAGYSYSEFGYLVSSDKLLGVRSNEPSVSDYSGPVISDHFILNSDAIGPGGVSVTPEEYIWLDVKVGESETGSTSNVNYRFVFEYN